MNFFENELRKLFANDPHFERPTFVGRACFVDLDETLRARIEFATTHTADHYNALRVTVMNRTEGVIDRMTFNLEDILGTKAVPNNPNFRNGVKPHIWVYNDQPEWYAYKPTQMDYKKIQVCINDYFDVYRPRQELEIGKDLSEQEIRQRYEQAFGRAPSQTIVGSIMQELDRDVHPNRNDNLFDDGLPVSEVVGEVVWICVYKDTLGYPDDHDNLTEICIPTHWLLEVLRNDMGVDPIEWFSDYTADSTDGIAVAAMNAGFILDCADPKIREKILPDAYLNGQEFDDRKAYSQSVFWLDDNTLVYSFGPFVDEGKDGFHVDCEYHTDNNTWHLVKVYDEQTIVMSLNELSSEQRDRIMNKLIQEGKQDPTAGLSHTKKLSFIDGIGYTEFTVSKAWYDKQPNKEDAAALFHLACADDKSNFTDLTGKYYQRAPSLSDQILRAENQTHDSRPSNNVKAKDMETERG